MTPKNLSSPFNKYTYIKLSEVSDAISKVLTPIYINGRTSSFSQLSRHLNHLGMADLTENNRKHFDKVASDHQNDFGELINTVITELKSRRGWISPKLTDAPNTDPAASDAVRLLDYACGAGTVSKALAPYATQTTGLDLSANMVSEYNKATLEMFGSHKAGHARMVGFQHDLLGDSTALPSGTLAPFDIIVIGMALHHVADAGGLLQRFSELLKPGGVCVVIDMVPDSAQLGEGASNLMKEGGVFGTIAKHGFAEAEMRELYEGAGMREFDYVVFEQRFRFTLFGEQCSSLGFIARGVKRGLV
ncbi:Methyltransferase domain protein [Aspergillus sclerotialis]|uniref:Methyltransferase domain protein n=1 Tax=Aspergillus sclerotialis TaxID=2070753 RepID=A0A3A3A4E8_9EURO|nr:Methyltransferase domain protein [Aspergillus sclerotialis]